MGQNTRQQLFLRVSQFFGSFCLRPVRSIVYSGAGSSNSGFAWYAEIRLVYKYKPYSALARMIIIVVSNPFVFLACF